MLKIKHMPIKVKAQSIYVQRFKQINVVQRNQKPNSVM